MLTNEKIREILAMEAKATRGPWEVDVEDGELTRDIMVGIYDDAEMIATAYDTVEDAILIALARNHIRELCDEVLRLREENERIRKSATELLDAMETCHVCKGTMSMDDIEPTHCEDCASDCDDHELPRCTPIYVLHGNLRRDLRNAD